MPPRWYCLIIFENLFKDTSVYSLVSFHLQPDEFVISPELTLVQLLVVWNYRKEGANYLRQLCILPPPRVPEELTPPRFTSSWLAVSSTDRKSKRSVNIREVEEVPDPDDDSRAHRFVWTWWRNLSTFYPRLPNRFFDNINIILTICESLLFLS